MKQNYCRAPFSLLIKYVSHEKELIYRREQPFSYAEGTFEYNKLRHLTF